MRVLHKIHDIHLNKTKIRSKKVLKTKMEQKKQTQNILSFKIKACKYGQDQIRQVARKAPVAVLLVKN